MTEKKPKQPNENKNEMKESTEKKRKSRTLEALHNDAMLYLLLI